MVDKILNTRIQLKHDSLANWQSKNTLLKKGEIAIAVIETVDPANKLHQPVMFKVGPGNFNDLEWASALAADVYAWAKKPSLDPNDLPEIPGLKLGISFEIVGEGNAITNVDYDTTNKKFTFTKGETFATKKELEDVVANGTVVAEGAKIDVAQNGNTYTVSHEAIAQAEAGKTVAARTYVTGVTTDGYGHITGYTTATEEDQDLSGYKTKQEAYSEAGSTVKTITNVTQNENGEIAVTYADIAFPEVTLPTVEDTAEDGKFVTEVDQTNGAIAVTRKAIEVAHADGQIYLTIDGKKIGTGFSDADFIKDGFLQSVTKDVANNTIIFTWNTDAGVTETTIDIDDLVEVYTGAEGIDITDFVVTIADAGVTTAKIADKNVTKAKLEDSVQASLNLADTALQAHQDISGKADKVSGAVSGNFAGLDANGNLTDSGKKAADFEVAGAAAKALADAKADTTAQIEALKLGETYEPIGAEGRAKTYTDELANGAVKANSDKIAALEALDYILNGDTVILDCGGAE